MSIDPFKEILNEIIAFNSIKDYNVISFIFNFPPDVKRLWAKTTYLINDLIVHEG